MSASPNTHKNISNPAHSSHHFTSPFPIAVGGDRLHRVQRWSSLPKLSSLHESRWAEPVFKCSVVCGSGGPGLWHVSKYTQTGTEQRPFTTKSFNVKYKTKKGWFVIYHHKFLRIINVVALFFFFFNQLIEFLFHVHLCLCFSDKLFPAFGFGAKLPPDYQVSSLKVRTVISCTCFSFFPLVIFKL